MAQMTLFHLAVRPSTNTGSSTASKFVDGPRKGNNRDSAFPGMTYSIMSNEYSRHHFPKLFREQYRVTSLLRKWEFMLQA